MDFGNDDQNLTANERLAKMKKKEEVRKMLSKQRYTSKHTHQNSNSFCSMQELNEHDYHDVGGGGGHSPYNQRRIEQVCQT